MRLLYLTGRGCQRTKLHRLVDAIAGVPSFQSVWDWFNHALPSLTEFFMVPHTRALNVRLKALEESIPSTFKNVGFYSHSPVDPDMPSHLIHS